MPAEPLNSNFERDIRQSFSRLKFMVFLNAELASVEAGKVSISMPFREDLTQQIGLIHAGVVAAIADTACGYAAVTLMPPGSDVISIEFKLNLLAPAVGDRLVARAEVVR